MALRFQRIEKIRTIQGLIGFRTLYQSRFINRSQHFREQSARVFFISRGGRFCWITCSVVPRWNGIVPAIICFGESFTNWDGTINWNLLPMELVHFGFASQIDDCDSLFFLCCWFCSSQNSVSITVYVVTIAGLNLRVLLSICSGWIRLISRQFQR